MHITPYPADLPKLDRALAYVRRGAVDELIRNRRMQLSKELVILPSSIQLPIRASGEPLERTTVNTKLILSPGYESWDEMFDDSEVMGMVINSLEMIRQSIDSEAASYFPWYKWFCSGDLPSLVSAPGSDGTAYYPSYTRDWRMTAGFILGLSDMPAEVKPHVLLGYGDKHVLKTEDEDFIKGLRHNKTANILRVMNVGGETAYEIEVTKRARDLWDLMDSDDRQFVVRSYDSRFNPLGSPRELLEDEGTGRLSRLIQRFRG